MSAEPQPAVTLIDNLPGNGITASEARECDHTRRCIYCGESLEDATQFEYEHSTCCEHLEPEEKELYVLLGESLSAFELMHTSGALYPTHQPLVALLIAKFYRAGVTPAFSLPRPVEVSGPGSLTEVRP